MAAGACTTTMSMIPMVTIHTTKSTTTTIGHLVEMEITAGTIRTSATTTISMVKMSGTTRRLITLTGVKKLEHTGNSTVIHTNTIHTMARMILIHTIRTTTIQTIKGTIHVTSKNTMDWMFTMAAGVITTTTSMIQMATTLTTRFTITTYMILLLEITAGTLPTLDSIYRMAI